MSPQRDEATGIRHRIEQSVWAVLAIVGVACVTLTYSVLSYIDREGDQARTDIHLAEIAALKSTHTEDLRGRERTHSLAMSERDATIEKLRQQIGDLESNLTSFTPGVSVDDLFDIGSRVRGGSSTGNIPEGAEPIGEGDLFAPRRTPYWTMKTTTDVDLMRDVFGQEHSTIFKNSQVHDTIHVWIADQTLPVDGHAFYRRLFPHISVRLSPAGIEPEARPAGVTDEHIADWRTRLTSGAAVGDLVVEELRRRLEFAASIRNTYLEILTVQMKKGVVYAKTRTTLYDVVVQERRYRRYFVDEHLIVISSARHFFFVRITLPSELRNGLPRHRVWVNYWLGRCIFYVE